MAENDDVNTLKRRGRRRLVGAIALVLAAVIVLPMVFEPEQKGSAPPVSVRIPGEDESGFTPKVTPKSPLLLEQKAAEKPAAKSAEKPAEKPEAKIEVAVTTGTVKPAAQDDAEQKRAEAALSGEQFVVQVGAFADPEKVKEVTGKLAAARIANYTEQIPVKSGMLTRVRAGPFGSREAAEKVLRQMKDLGLKPGNVATKS